MKKGDTLEILANFPSFKLIEDGNGLAHYEKVPKYKRKFKLSVG